MALTISGYRCPQNHRCPLLNVCPTGAITQEGYGLPKIDDSKCIECGKCTKFCGMGAITNIYAYENSPENNFFATKGYNLLNGFLVDTFAQGKYPDYWNAYLENRGWMPTFEEGDEELLKYTVDYIAFSYYRSNTVKTGEFDYERPAHECVNEKQIKNPHCEANEWDWEIDPVGFRWTLNDLHHRTGLPVFVLENGIGWREDMSQEEVDQMLAEGRTIEDDYRINYHRDHIKEMENAIFEDGVDCLGYITWGPIDILASMCNMDKRYGFVYVNRTNKDLRDMKRIPKKSYQWIKKAFESNGADVD